MLEKILIVYWKSFLYRLWLGEIRLVTCFWMYYLLLQAVLIVLIMIIGVPIWIFFGFTRIYTVLGLSLFGLYLFIATIGTWRSSNKYSDSKFMTLAVKSVLVFFGVYYMIFFVVLLPYVDQIFYSGSPR